MLPTSVMLLSIYILLNATTKYNVVTETEMPCQEEMIASVCLIEFP